MRSEPHQKLYFKRLGEKDRFGSAPLHFACASRVDPDVLLDILFLLRIGADPLAINKQDGVISCDIFIPSEMNDPPEKARGAAFSL